MSRTMRFPEWKRHKSKWHIQYYYYSSRCSSDASSSYRNSAGFPLSLSLFFSHPSSIFLLYRREEINDSLLSICFFTFSHVQLPKVFPIRHGSRSVQYSGHGNRLGRPFISDSSFVHRFLIVKFLVCFPPPHRRSWSPRINNRLVLFLPYILSLLYEW